jgi:tRNA-dihydrouridine synthase
VTVHGRTRSQFYAGTADWGAVREVCDAAPGPTIVNGDVVDLASARAALAASGASAVMIGRGAIGRPWLARVIEAGLAGRPAREPGLAERLEIVLDHLALSVRLQGERLGVMTFRKHLAAYVEAAAWPADPSVRREARARLCRLESECEIGAALRALWAEPARERQAA